LLTGLAGSLTLADISALARIGPDILGFRGALCGERGRSSALCGERVQSIRSALDAARGTRQRRAAEG